MCSKRVGKPSDDAENTEQDEGYGVKGERLEVGVKVVVMMVQREKSWLEFHCCARFRQFTQ